MTFRSMTGFGSAKASKSGLELNVEIKSVNHRFLDISYKLPAQYGIWESELGRLLREKVKRGRIDVLVTRAADLERSIDVQLNEQLFKKYFENARKALNLAGVGSKESVVSVVASMLERRDMITVAVPEVDLPSEQEVLKAAFDEALGKLVVGREIEGRALAADLEKNLSLLEGIVAEVRANVKDVALEFKRRLTERLATLAPGVELDPQRLALEVAILADRVDVSEEISRLQSHCQQFRQIVKHAEGGKKLDFFIQEMNREINTIGSKAQSSVVTNYVVEAKALLEKLREQVQNVE